jgi:uncharacterized membrane protein
MESKTKFLGHPVHPMLVVIPLGLFIAAVVFDGVAFAGGPPELGTVAFWNIIGGVVGGIAAAVFGLLDWRAIPPRTRAKRVATLHGGINAVVLLIFGLVWTLRSTQPDLAAGALFFVELGALVLGAVAAWLGGELVDRLAVGVDDGAHVDAPSSLSRQPARR